MRRILPASTRRLGQLAVAAGVIGAVSVGTMTSASASDSVIGPEGYYSGHCPGTSMCLFYRADTNGAVFATDLARIDNLGSYYFSSNTSLDGSTGSQGAGVSVRNAAHSVENDSAYYESFWVSPNETGNENQIAGYGAYGNFTSTLVNNEASYWNTCVPNGDC
jgi:hypothetical protein